MTKYFKEERNGYQSFGKFVVINPNISRNEGETAILHDCVTIRIASDGGLRFVDARMSSVSRSAESVFPGYTQTDGSEFNKYAALMLENLKNFINKE